MTVLVSSIDVKWLCCVALSSQISVVNRNLKNIYAFGKQDKILCHICSDVATSQANQHSFKPGANF